MRLTNISRNNLLIYTHVQCTHMPWPLTTNATISFPPDFTTSTAVRKHFGFVWDHYLRYCAPFVLSPIVFVQVFIFMPFFFFSFAAGTGDDTLNCLIIPFFIEFRAFISLGLYTLMWNRTYVVRWRWYFLDVRCCVVLSPSISIARRSRRDIQFHMNNYVYTVQCTYIDFGWLCFALVGSKKKKAHLWFPSNFFVRNNTHWLRQINEYVGGQIQWFQHDIGRTQSV